MERAVGYNRFLVACARVDDLEGAERMFESLKQSNCPPSAAAFHALATLYARRGLVERCALAGDQNLNLDLEI